MKKFISIILVCSIIASFFLFPSAGEKALAEGPVSSNIGSTISDWVLDEPNGYIYAVSNADKKLLFIRTSDLQVTKSMDFSEAPTDIDLDNGKIYVPVEMKKEIIVVDAASQNIADTYETVNYPIRTDVLGDKLFYTSSDNINTYEQWCSLNVFNMTSKTELKIKGANFGDYTYFCPDIAIDRQRSVIYIGGSRISTGTIISLSAADYSKLSSNASINFTGFYFSSPSRKVICDGHNVYYSGNALSPDNLNKLNGRYNEAITYVNGPYVFTENAVYTRDTYQKITVLPFASSNVLMDSQSNEYLFNASTKTLLKTNLDLSQQPAIQHRTIQNGIQFDQSITEWVYDANTDFIYAISNTANILLYIDAATLEITGEKFIGSFPSDIELYNNQIYVALNGTTKVARTGTSLSSSVELIDLSTIPNKIALDDNKLFYVEEDQWCDLYVYNLADHTDKKTGPLFYEPDITIDRDNNILYVGNMSGSTNVYSYRTSDYIQISKGGISGSAVYGSKMGFDGSDVYYAGYRFNGMDLTKQKGCYNGSVQCISNDYVIASNGIYDRNTYQKLYSLPYTVDLAAVSKTGSVYLFSDTSKSLFKYSAITPIASAINITGSTSIMLPASGDTSETFAAEVKDQYGYVITNAAVTWSLVSPVNGVSIDQSGKVTVTTSAQPGSFTIQAAVGSVSRTYTVQLTKTYAAPTGLAGNPPTTAANNNGKITGVTTAMEYRISTASVYKPVSGTSITGLLPGIYYVRYKAANGLNASPDTKVLLPPYMTSNATRDMLNDLLDTGHMYLDSNYAYMYEPYLYSAVTMGTEVKNNANATQDEINIAVFYLIKETDRAYLEDLITIAKAKKQSDYNSDRWLKLQTETASSESLLKNPASLVTDVSYADDKMYFILNTLPAFDALIDIAQTRSHDYCTDKTWDLLQAALPGALELQANPFWRFNEVNASIGELLYAIFSWQLDWSIELGDTLISYGNTFYRDSTWTELNSAYDAALTVQKQSNPSMDDLGNAYNRLASVDYRAFMEDMVQFSKNMQQSNCIAEDWSALQTSLNKAKELLENSAATFDQLKKGTENLVDTYKTIIDKAPHGLTGVAPTTSTSSDGKITGTSSIMEYRLDTGNSGTPWTAISGTSVTGLAPGSYQVRYAENHIADAGVAATVAVPAYTPGGGGGTPGGGTPGGGTPGGGAPDGGAPSGGGSPGGGGGGGGGVLGATSKMFWDVSVDDWFFNAVQYVVNAGMFSGTSEMRFEPGAPMTRAMLVTVLYRLDGQPAVSTANPFTDVAPGMWYTKAVIWAAKNGIATGFTSHTFKPGANITREQLADILYNYAKYKGYDITIGSSFNLQKFSDASRITAYAKNAMKWACGAGLISGKTPTTLAPKDNASRAEVAFILQRFMGSIVK